MERMAMQCEGICGGEVIERSTECINTPVDE